MNTVEIKSVEKKQSEKTRLEFNLEINKSGGVLWFETDNEWGEYLCDELADGVLVMLLSFILRGGYDVKSHVPVSEKLYYGITKQLIPQLRVCEQKSYESKFVFPLVNINYDPQAVGAGLSCGVDSFATLLEYTRDCRLENYKLTHLTFYENGAHHNGIGGYDDSQEKIYLGEREHVTKFCKQYGYPLINVRSNLNRFLSEYFWDDGFEWTHTYRNLGLTLLFQKLFCRYYYSPGVNTDSFECGLNCDPAHYECFLLSCLCTNNIEFLNSNEGMNRVEKINYISKETIVCENLVVCYKDAKNCGRCVKCIRTLLAIDFLGLLERYKTSFDIEKYKKNRKWYLGYLCKHRNDDQFIKEIYLYAKKNNISIPFECQVKGTILLIGRTIYQRLRGW